MEIFCVLHAHFDLEGARPANLENKHDLVIKSHYKLMLHLKNTFTFVLRRICVFFTPEPFTSTLCLAGWQAAVRGKSWDCCSFPSAESLQ